MIEDIVCTYIDLDRLIAGADLSPGEKRTVENLMLGYSMSDIADHFKITRQTVGVELQRAVRKICDLNNRIWSEVYSDALASERPDLTI